MAAPFVYHRLTQQKQNPTHAGDAVLIKRIHRHMPPVGLLADQAVPNSSDDDARAALAYFFKKGQTAKTPTEARTDNTEAAKLRHL